MSASCFRKWNGRKRVKTMSYYVPVLRWKAAEKGALEELSDEEKVYVQASNRTHPEKSRI